MNALAEMLEATERKLMRKGVVLTEIQALRREPLNRLLRRSGEE